MRETLTYGSVRGAARKGRPYRDPHFPGQGAGGRESGGIRRLDWIGTAPGG